MKIFCKQHGAHFPEEFEQTVRCPFWKQWGLGGLPKKYKKQIWDYQFALNVDEIAVKTNYSISIDIRGKKLSSKDFVNEWEENIPGYKKWSDKKRRDYQKLYILTTQKLPESEIRKLNMQAMAQYIKSKHGKI